MIRPARTRLEGISCQCSLVENRTASGMVIEHLKFLSNMSRILEPNFH